MAYTGDARVGCDSGRAGVFYMNSNNDASNNNDNYGARVNPILTIYNAGVDPHFLRIEN